MAARTRVTILGSGWGAFGLLKGLNPKQYAVSVVSPRNHMLFTPLLASASVGTVNPRSICEPLRPFCASQGARYFEAHAESVDFGNQTVKCRSLRGESYPLEYDRLVVAVGYRANDFNLPGIKEHALFMKETADATRFRESFLERLEQASYTHMLDGDEHFSAEEEARVRQLLSVVIVGGGPTGVELAAEVTDFAKNEVATQYPHLADFVSVNLVEGTSSVLGHLEDKALRDYAMDHLMKKQGVKLHTNEFVTKATDRELLLKSGNAIPFGTLVWCAGVQPMPIVKSLDIAKTKNGAQLLTDSSLRVVDQQHVFAIGDCAQIDGNRLPQTAQVAKQQAQYLAKEFNKGEVFAQPFLFKSLGSMAYLGSNRALIANSPVLKRLTGYLAWIGWRSAYWGMQFSMRNRIAIAVDWASSAAFGRPLTRFGGDSLHTEVIPAQRRA